MWTILIGQAKNRRLVLGTQNKAVILQGVKERVTPNAEFPPVSGLGQDLDKTGEVSMKRNACHWQQP